jgi:hypothetical protein
MSVTHDLITWCSSPTMSARALLDRARKRGVANIAAIERGPDFPARFPLGEFPGAVVEQLEWHEAREKWRRDHIGSPVMDGLNLPRLPWGPGPEALTTELAAFALASLDRIATLAEQLTAANSDAQEWRERSDKLKAAADAERQRRDSVEAELRARLAVAEKGLADARQEVRDLGRDRSAALEQAEAWRVSANASGDALATLRAALRIPGSVEDLPVSLRLQQGPEVAAVRRALGGG